MIIAFLRRTLSLTGVVLRLILNKGDNSWWEQQSQEIFLVSFCSWTWPVYLQPKGIKRETIEGINRLSFQQGSCAKEMTLLALFPLKKRFVSLRNQHKGTKLFPEAPFSPPKRSWGFNCRSKRFGVYPSTWDNPTRFFTSHVQTIIREKVSVRIFPHHHPQAPHQQSLF